MESDFTIRDARVGSLQRSADGTIKNAVRLHDGLTVESVLIPTARRTTACVSSQVGCSFNCEFCATARLSRARNLNPDEIYDQVVLLGEQSQRYFHRPLSNIVFMGMGEPLLNYHNVLAGIDKITSDRGLALSPRRITLSTSGVPKLMKRLADDAVRFRLALSLHAARDAVRTRIMPFNQRFPLADIAEALRYWYRRCQRPVTYEYIIWEAVNDQPQDILALVDFCKLIPCKVNIIEYNPIEGGAYRQAPLHVVQAYEHALEKSGIPFSLRRSRGRDIDAACGQLANNSR